MARTLLNLLDNAYKYSPVEKRITLRATCEDGHVVFAVKDNGIGIAQREQKRIFGGATRWTGDWRANHAESG